MTNEFVQFITYVKENLIKNEKFYLSGTVNEIRIAKSLSDTLFIFKSDFSVSIVDDSKEVLIIDKLDLARLKQLFSILFL